MINTRELFNCIGDGKEKPNYNLIAAELHRLRAINNDFFSTHTQKEDALADVGKIAAGLFNRAGILDGIDIDQWD